VQAPETTGIDPDAVISASLSDIGKLRSGNEDSCGEFVREGVARLMVVADGMGGHRGGATASQTAVAAVGEAFERSLLDDPENDLRAAILGANRRIYDLAQENAELRGMGTTLVCLLLLPGETSWIAHVGDSRAYRFRAGELEPLTDDHSVVGEMVRQGVIMAEEAEYHPRRNEILRSVGIEPGVRIDLQPISPQPGDRYLLCSDGLTGLISDYQIETVIASFPPGEAAERLVQMANGQGGHDNITVQVAEVVGPRSEAEEVPSGGLLMRWNQVPPALRWAVAAIVAVILALLWLIPR